MTPGLCTVVWASDTAIAAVARARAQLLATRPAIVMLHVSLGAEHVPEALAQLRAMLPGVRLWLGLGGNPLAAMDRATMLARAEAWAITARDAGCELLMLNLEQDDPGGRKAPRPSHGWNLVQWPGREVELREKAHALVRSVAAVLPVALTSHDCPQFFELPWHELLGEDSPVVLFAPQHYPGRTGGATLGEMRDRVDELSATGWTYRTRGGQVAVRYAPRGSAWAPYTQLYLVKCPALTWAADQAPIAVLGWTLGDADPDGRSALAASCIARRESEGAGSLARWQAAHGLEADSAAGALTLRAMGMLS